MGIATTGIAGLDAQLGGGVPRGTTLLLVAEPGNAVPLFSEQFAGGGLDAGEDLHYFELDRPVSGLRASIEQFIMRGNEGKARFTLYDGYAPSFGRAAKTRDPNAISVAPSDTFSAATKALENVTAQKPYRLVVESLSALARPENERELVDFVRNATYLGHELGGLHLLSIIKGLHSSAAETQMRHYCDGVIEFGSERKGFGIYNYLVVTKMLGVRDPVKIMLWKDTDKGVWLESTKRVF